MIKIKRIRDFIEENSTDLPLTVSCATFVPTDNNIDVAKLTPIPFYNTKGYYVKRFYRPISKSFNPDAGNE